MNILIVATNIPSPTWGASSRNYYLLKALANKHRVSLLALSTQTEKSEMNDFSLLKGLVSMAQIVPLKPSKKRWQQLIDLLSRKSYVMNSHTLIEIQSAIDELCAQNDYDLILFETVLIANYRLPRTVKKVIDQHNIEYELHRRTFKHETARLRKWYSWLESSHLKPIELGLCRKADLVLVTSEREQQKLHALLPEAQIEVVPNGVNIQQFNGVEEVEEVPNRIIFTGTMDYYPNIDAVLYFAQQCWPLIQEQVPDATWQIVGKNPSAEIQSLALTPGITVTGTVADVSPYLASAAVAIAPLHIGSGTRLKILEALAMRKAVVTTSVGCEGLAVEGVKHLLIADRPEKFAQAVIQLLKDPELRTKLGNAGRALVEAKYSWEYCGAQLLQAIETHFEEREPYAYTTSA